MHVTNAETGQRVFPFAARAVLPIAAVTALVHCVTSAFGGDYWFDEVYMLAIGRYHLDWGSADQPPLAPALAALTDALALGSMVALRAPAVLATVGGVVLAGLIARELGCDARAQGFTAAAQATGAWTTLFGHWLTPYTLEPIQWLLIGWLLVRWVRLRDDRLLLLLGVAVGIAAMTKFQVLLLCVVLVIAVGIAGPRELLGRPMLWVGAGVAVVICAPTVIWQGRNDWPQLRMAPVVASEAEALYGGRPGIAVELIVFAGVAGTGLVLYGLWRLLRDDELRDYRFIGVAFVGLYVVFAVTAGRPYYLAGLYGLLAAAGALGLQRRREVGKRPRRCLIWPAYGLSVALAVGMLMLSVSIVRAPTGEQIAERAADAFHAIPPSQRDRTILFGESYIVAAYLDGYSRRYALPAAYSANRSYGYFPEPPADDDSVLYIGRDPGALGRYFADVRRLGDVGEDMHTYLLTGKRRPWHEFWPQLRTLTVA
jgi:hypothetical protein